jgi:hypothetical protein
MSRVDASKNPREVFVAAADKWPALPFGLSAAGRYALVADQGRVRVGGQAPMLMPDLVRDEGLVRLGGQSPLF